MLIVTERHKPEDLEIWKDYEEIDAIHAQEKKLNFKIEKAAESLIAFTSSPCYLGVSWGKDSVVVADLCARNKIGVPFVHLRCIPSHNAYCDMVRDEFLKKYPSVFYKEIIVDYSDIYARNLPPHIQDKLTDIEWYKGFKEASIQFGDRHISGVRGKESNVRMLRMKRWGISSPNTCAPIGYWSTDDVFAYLYTYNLPVHPNYGMLGGGRWNRERIRTAEIGDIHGTGGGRTEWEREYYPDILARIKKPL